jgi:hypothetical protein
VLSKPEDVAWDPRGILYVLDSLHHRIVALSTMSATTGGMVQYFGPSLAVTNDGFTISWFAQSNWFYSAQYADTLGGGVWQFLPGATNIMGREAVTSVTDRTVGSVTTRFYRVIAY